MTESSAELMTSRRLALVADDEPAIRDLLERVLRPLGLGALCVGDGAAAIAAAEAHRDKLSCAIMDIVMPVVNGVDAALAIQRAAPDLPIVLMSGAVPAQCADGIAQLRLAGMLPKPFDLVELRDLIRRAVGGDILRKKEDSYGEHQQRTDKGPEAVDRRADR
ncbi:MAG: response regulator [Kouleothrix sp.]|nr:response regulator [Kouleothrix sp.]